MDESSFYMGDTILEPDNKMGIHSGRFKHTKYKMNPHYPIYIEFVTCIKFLSLPMHMAMIDIECQR